MEGGVCLVHFRLLRYIKCPAVSRPGVSGWTHHGWVILNTRTVTLWHMWGRGGGDLITIMGNVSTLWCTLPALLVKQRIFYGIFVSNQASIQYSGFRRESGRWIISPASVFSPDPGNCLGFTQNFFSFWMRNLSLLYRDTELTQTHLIQKLCI